MMPHSIMTVIGGGDDHCDHLALDFLPFLSRLRPRDRQPPDFAAPFGFYQMVECFENDSPLKLAMERYAEVIPHHEWDEDGARRLRVFRHVECHSY